jgi:hypothetical protein
MAYKILNTDGTTLLLLADNRVDQAATSLSLVGKNVSSYGEYINNNFVKLLANSASTAGAQPRSPLIGQLWFDTTAKRLKVYDGSFKPVSGALVSGTSPTSPVPGDFWFDSVNFQLNTWNGDAWTIVGPPFQKRVGENGWIIPQGSVQDRLGANQTVTLIKNYGSTLGLISTGSFTTTYFTTATTLLTTATTPVYKGLNIFGSVFVTDTVTATNTVSTTALVSRTVNVTGTTSSTSTSTGALQVVGGVGIGGDLWVGGDITANKLTIQYTTITTISTVIDDVTTITNITQSSSPITGALAVAGGMGVSKKVFIGESLNVPQIAATGTVVTTLTATNIFSTATTIITLTATNIIATGTVVTSLTATNITATSVLVTQSLSLNNNPIINVADPAADQHAVTRKFLYSRSIVLSMDISDGISNSGIITYLSQIAPVSEYTNGTTARILCTSITNSSTTVLVNAALNKTTASFLQSTTTSALALTDVTVTDPSVTPTILVTRSVKTFQISGGSWIFVS